jgi:hypothetical protein
MIPQMNQTNPNIYGSDDQRSAGGFELKHFKEKKEFEPSFYKSLFLDILNLAAAALLGYAAKFYFENKISLIVLSSFIFIFLVIVSIQAILNKSWKRRILILISEGILFIYFLFGFNFGLNKINILFNVFLIFIIFRLWGDVKTYFYLKNSIKIKFGESSRNVFGKSTSGIILTLIIFYIFSLNSPMDFFSYNLFQKLWDQIAPSYNRLYPEIVINGTVDDFINSISMKELNQQKGFNELFPDERQKIINQAKEEVKKNILSLFKVENVEANKNFQEFFYETINQKLDNLYQKFGDYVLFILILFLFLFWKSLSGIFWLFFRGFMFVFLHLLIVLGFIRLDLREVSQEYINF